MIGEEENFSDVIHNLNEDNNVLSKTFFWMFLGLLGTALVSWYTYSSGLFLTVLTGGFFGPLLILEIIVVLLFSFLFRKLPATIVGILYFLYAAINGVCITTIFYVFDLNSIILLFVVSSLLFGGFSLYGYVTKKDLSNWRTLLFGTLLAGLVASLFNLFFQNSTFDIIIDWIILFIFFGITAYDINKIKQLSLIDTIDQDKIHIYGAMELYLDFINIFLRILSIFGKKKD